MVADVDGEAGHGQPARPQRQLQAAADHQVHGGAPVDGLVEELEHQALVHAGVVAPEVLAVAEQPGALALLDHLGEDIHVGGELARLGPVAAVLVDAELDRVEGGDPDVDDELRPLRFLCLFVAPGLGGPGGRRQPLGAFHLGGALQHFRLGLAGCFGGRGIGLDLDRPASVCHERAPREERRAREDGVAQINLRNASTAMRTSEAFLNSLRKKLCVPPVAPLAWLRTATYGAGCPASPLKPVAIT